MNLEDGMNPKEIERLYKTTRQMPLITVVAMIFPFILVFLAGASILWIPQRQKLLKASTDEFGEDVRTQVEYIRSNGLYLWIPWIAIVVVALCGVYIFNSY